jgi:hypothetical protein
MASSLTAESTSAWGAHQRSGLLSDPVRTRSIPEEAVRRHLAHEEGIELAAICSHEGRSFSQGAIACMAAQRMTCDATGSWVQDGSC